MEGGVATRMEKKPSFCRRGARAISRTEANNMNPVSDFSDPSLILERKQYMEVGCGGCCNHVRNEERTAFKCLFDMDGYPDKTNKTCTQWRQRTGGRRG